MGIGAQMLTLLITAILGFFGIFLVEVHTKRKDKKMIRGKGEPESSIESSSGEMEKHNENEESDKKNENNITSDKSTLSTTPPTPIKRMEKPTNEQPPIVEAS
jgi:hypothetical protein